MLDRVGLVCRSVTNKGTIPDMRTDRVGMVDQILRGAAG